MPQTSISRSHMWWLNETNVIYVADAGESAAGNHGSSSLGEGEGSGLSPGREQGAVPLSSVLSNVLVCFLLCRSTGRCNINSASASWSSEGRAQSYPRRGFFLSWVSTIGLGIGHQSSIPFNLFTAFHLSPVTTTEKKKPAKRNGTSTFFENKKW